MTIGGIQKSTLIDYPGKIAATVFLAGCNLRCPWCYSAELVLPEKIKNQPKLSEKELFSFLEERKDLLDGIVVCGGEPTVNKDLPLLLGKIKKMGFSVKLDTNGTNPEDLKGLAEKKLIDYVAMDVKLPKERYQKVLETDPERIDQSISFLKQGKIDYEFRTTIVPQVLEKKDIIEIANWIKGADKYYIQNFKAEKTLDPAFADRKPYSDEYLKEILESVKPLFKVCHLRG
jgi:pyruvate formate lyase activating enzyme